MFDALAAASVLVALDLVGCVGRLLLGGGRHLLLLLLLLLRRESVRGVEASRRHHVLDLPLEVEVCVGVASASAPCSPAGV